MMGRSGLSLAPLVAVIAASCAPPAMRSAVAPLPAASLGLGIAPAPAVDPEWWKGFGDPQLDRIVADALAGAPSLDAALARLRQADAALGRARAELRPQLAADVQPQVSRLSGRYIIPPPYAGSTRFVDAATVGLAWNLDLFGRQRAAIRQAGDLARASAWDADAARLALAGAVAQTYVDLSRAEAQAAIARRAIATREGSLGLVKVQLRNRLASRLQLTAAETLLAQARQALLAAEGARALAADALAALAGRGADYAAAIQPSALRLDATPPLPEALPADLLARRPDVAAAEARVAAAAQGQEAARRAYYPNVNLSALAGLQAIGLGNILSLDATTASAGPALHLPLFQGGRLRADLAGATAARDEATADYNERVIAAVREAADAIALVGNLQARRAESGAVVRGFAETQRLNDVRVASGLDSKLDLVDSGIRLLDAELADANLAADVARERVALVLALGGGLPRTSLPSVPESPRP